MKTNNFLPAFSLTLASFLFPVSCILYPVFSSAQYTNLHNFDGTNGVVPYGTPVTDGTFLYGMTAFGGTSNMGTLFKIMPDGTGFSTIFNFTGPNGSNPRGSLIYDGTFLYGMTTLGGTNNLGTIFKIMPNGTGFVNLLHFAGSSNGRLPYGSLMSDGTFLYGMTYGGGVSDLGTVFKIMPDGTGYVRLLDFFGPPNGSLPYGSLVSDGTFLYGMTSEGGTNTLGTVFRMMPDGTGYTLLHSFSLFGEGDTPYGSLYFDGTFLYGMTHDGGTNGYGTIFKMLPDGTGYTTLLNFIGANGAGAHMGCTLISDGTFLYGMTTEGGQDWKGNIFKIMPDGTGFVNLWDFNGNATGGYPFGSLYYDGTFVYGMTSDDGAFNLGTVFRFNPYCTPVTYTWSPTICEGDSVTVGSNNYTVSGTYTDVFPFVQNGCDSTVVTNLTVTMVDTFAFIVSASIMANAGGASYQWLDCNNGFALIPGEINQIFSPIVTGSYAVVVTQNGCSDTSSCYNIIITEVAETPPTNTPFVYPNPSGGRFSVTLNDGYRSGNLRITTIIGEEIFATSFTNAGTLHVEITEKPGVYLLILENVTGQRLIIRLVKS